MKVSFCAKNAKLLTNDRVTTLNMRVKKSIVSILLKTICSCSHKTREYKLSYKKMDDMTESDTPFKLKDIEKVKKDIKGKHYILD